MNIYKMNYKETMKENEKFKKTNFGKRVFLLSTVFPIISFVLLTLLLIVDGYVNNDANLFVLCGLLALNFSCLGLSFMLYFNMLKDFINSKNDK